MATRVLHSSLLFLNRKNISANRAIRSQMRFGELPEAAVAWAADTRPMANVCVRCGDGRMAADVRTRYVCAGCGAKNIGVAY